MRIFLVLTLLVVTGCSRSIDQPFTPSEINSLDIVFVETDDPNLQSASSFNTSNGRLSSRAEFRIAVELDTDRSFQGFEFLAYIAPDNADSTLEALYLLDYSLTSSARIRKLLTFQGTVCELEKIFISDQQVLDEEDRRLSPLLNVQAVIARTVNPDTGNCNALENEFEISFDFSEDASEPIEVSQRVPTSRETLINYALLANDDNLRTFYLVSQSGVLSLNGEDRNNVWSVPIPDGSASVNAIQVNNDLVILQTNQRVYIRTVQQLIEAGDVDNNGNQTIQNAVFGPDFYLLANADLDNPIAGESDENNATFSDGNILVQFSAETERFEEIVTLGADVQSYDFFPVSSTQVIVLTRFADRNELSVFNLNGAVWTESQILLGGLAADRVDAELIGRDFYVNAFNLGQNNSQLYWQALFFDTDDLNIAPVTYDNSSFVIMTRVDRTLSEPYIVNSRAIATNGSFITPDLFEFNEANPASTAAILTDINNGSANSTDPRTRFIGQLEGEPATNIDIVFINQQWINDEFARLNASYSSDVTDPVDFESDAVYHVVPEVLVERVAGRDTLADQINLVGFTPRD